MARSDRWLWAWGLGYVAVGAASLLVPLYAVSLGAGPFLVGILAATAAFAAVPGALLWGYLADRTGRRRIFVVVALGATALVLGMAPLVRTPWPLVGLNTVLWFVVSAAAPVLNLLVVDGTPESAWEDRIAALNAWQGYGWVGGLALGSVWIPVVGRLLDPTAARTWLFWVVAVVAGLAAVAAIRLLPSETSVTPRRLARTSRFLARIDLGAGRYVRAVPFATTRLYWALRSVSLGRLRGRLSRRLWLYLLGVGIFSAGFAVFWAPLPAYLAGFYADERVFWFFLATNAAAAVGFTRVAGWVASTGAARLQTGALAARGLLFPVVPVVVGTLVAPIELPLLLAVFALIGLTWAVIAVTATGLVTRLGGAERGTALGLYAAVAGAGGGIGSVLGGAIAAGGGYPLAFGVAGGLVLLGVLVVVGLVIGRAGLRR